VKKMASKFLDFVQAHEREWGKESYPGKPSLAQMLESPVVVFWRPTSDKVKTRMTATMYADMKGIEDHFVKLVTRSQIEPPKNRIAHIFHNQKSMRIRGVRIEFAEAD
jgi:hypothetical protein